jgi:hypothetical protein
METVWIYRYEIYDLVSRAFVPQLLYATEHAITCMNGICMYSTAAEVPVSQVTTGGVWLRPPHSPGPGTH